MFPYRRILFPVDFSPANAAVAPFVRDFAHRFESNLQLIHATPPEVFYAAEFGWQIAAASPTQDERVAVETRRLEDFAAAHFPGLAPECVVHSGYPVAVVEDAVRRNGTDLIMLPTHGRGMFKRLLLGSVTAKLIHDLSCSVWTGAHLDSISAKVHSPYRRIVAAIEPGTECAHIVKAAEGLATTYGATLAFVSAIEWPSDNPGVDAGNYWDRMRKSAEEELASVSRVVAIPATTDVVYGPIPRALHDAATQHMADLLVIGRGDSQSPLSGVLSNLYAIVRESPCPVLAV